MPDTLAIIPARGGSKGIPGKNLRPLAGKPLLVYTIEQARQSEHINRVVVSTDNDEIAEVSLRYGAEVIHRPAEISGDTSTSEAALVHVLDTLEREEGYVPELVTFLQCTAPIRRPHDIDSAIEMLLERGADSLLSVVPFHLFIWREANGWAEPLDYDPRQRPMRQNRVPEYIENGSLYVFRPWVLRTFNSRLGGKIAIYEMDEWSAVDINGLADLELTEWIIQRQFAGLVGAP
jgi:N-acylneuraminate cytidylyltransferase